MGRPTRHNSRSRANDPEALAAGLPAELKTFDAWLYDDNGMTTGLRDYMTALAAQVAPHEAVPVMNAAGLSVASWYRRMMAKG